MRWRRFALPSIHQARQCSMACKPPRGGFSFLWRGQGGLITGWPESIKFGRVLRARHAWMDGWRRVNLSPTPCRSFTIPATPMSPMYLSQPPHSFHRNPMRKFMASGGAKWPSRGWVAFSRGYNCLMGSCFAIELRDKDSGENEKRNFSPTHSYFFQKFVILA